MTIPNLIFFFISLLGALLSLFFFMRKVGDKFLNRLVAIYTLLFAHEMFVNCLMTADLLETIEFIHLGYTRFPAGPIYGALVYIYVRRVFTGATFKNLDFLFLIPPFIIFLLCSPFYFKSASDKLQIAEKKQIFDFILLPDYSIWVIIAIMFFYAFFTFIKFQKHYKIGLKEMVWLRCFVGSYLGFVIVFSLYIFLLRSYILPTDTEAYYIVDIVITLFILMLCYFAVVQPNVFDEKKSIRDLLPFIKYRKNGLSPAMALELKENLMKVMIEDKPYLKSNLRLDDMASALRVTRNQASQVINENFNKSFSDFINEHRINDSKKLLLDNSENLNIEGIAYTVGFNNRASFYKAFKKFTNLTPKAFIRLNGQV